MYIIRDTFQCKPGMAKELIKKFVAVSKYIEAEGVQNVKMMTDVVSNYWTVCMEMEVDSLSRWESSQGFSSKPEVRDIMKDYMTLVDGGKREIFKIEHEIKGASSKEASYLAQQNIPV